MTPTPHLDLDDDEPEPPRSRVLRLLNQAEDLATAAEDTEPVFEIMALKERLGLPVKRPSNPPN